MTGGGKKEHAREVSMEEDFLFLRRSRGTRVGSTVVQHLRAMVPGPEVSSRLPKCDLGHARIVFNLNSPWLGHTHDPPTFS